MAKGRGWPHETVGLLTGDRTLPQTGTNTESFMGPRLREGAFIGISAVCALPVAGPAHLQRRRSRLVRHGQRRQNRQCRRCPTGAWLADVFFSLVGYTAYLFPLLLAYRAVIILLDRHEANQFDWTDIRYPRPGPGAGDDRRHRAVRDERPGQLRPATGRRAAFSARPLAAAFRRPSVPYRQPVDPAGGVPVRHDHLHRPVLDAN